MFTIKDLTLYANRWRFPEENDGNDWKYSREMSTVRVSRLSKDRNKLDDGKMETDITV